MPTSGQSLEARAPKPRRRRLQQRDWAPYVFLAPLILFFIIFFLLPIGFSLYLSFTRWNPLSTPHWIGLKNYEYLLTIDPRFWRTILNTFVFAFGSVFIGIPVSLVVAHLVMNSRFKPLWRSIYWLPMVTNVVAIGFVWWLIMNPANGVLNRMLALVGISGPAWLADPKTAMFAIIIVAVWAGIGRDMLLFSAGLEGIPESYYEAASIDGTNGLQSFLHITLPLLRPTLLFVSITSFIAGMGSFTLILVMTAGAPGGPMDSTNVAALYMYQMAFEDLRMGRAAAAAFVLFIIIFFITLVQLRIFRRGGVEPY